MSQVEIAALFAALDRIENLLKAILAELKDVN